MKFELAYGKTGLTVDLPERNVVKCLACQSRDPLADPCAAVIDALNDPIGTPPLAELAHGRTNACIVVCDFTRPVPNQLLLTPMLNTLVESGIPRERITILIATGLHRPAPHDELVEILGREIVENYRVENHVASDVSQHVDLGTSPRGVPMLIDRRYVEADLKITVGLIEPHFMAGYSGGRKLICPGIAGESTIRTWHSPTFLEHPNAVAGLMDGNPVHEENTWVATQAGCDFILNVAIDRDRRVLDVVAGDMVRAHLRGAQFVESMVVDTVEEPVDIVVTTSAGYPLDATYYQTIKGLVAAGPIVHEGGTVIIASRIAEGIGSPAFEQIYAENDSLDQFMDRIVNTEYTRVDQWQLEMFARVARKADIRVVTEGLSHDALRCLYVEPSDSVEQAVAEAIKRYGPNATIAVIPEGPYVLATALSKSNSGASNPDNVS